jgi:hypothetical protein
VEAIMMSLVRDVLVILGDAARLSESLMQHTFEAPRRVVKRSIGRLLTCVAVCTASLILAGAGVGFILAGAFILLARAMDSPGVAGLVIGFALLLIALAVAIIGRSLVGWPRTPA